MYSERQEITALTWAPSQRLAPRLPPLTPLPQNQSHLTRVPRRALPRLCSTKEIRTVTKERSNEAPIVNFKAWTWATAALTNWLASQSSRAGGKCQQNNQNRTGGTHLIGGELLQQLLLPLLSCHTINMARERSKAIVKLGTSPSVTLPSSNGGSEALESLALLAKPGQNLWESASNTQVKS